MIVPLRREAHPFRLDLNVQRERAGELGFSTMAKLRAHVRAMDKAWNEIERGSPSPDSDARTLHIRCGSDIRSTLADAGFGGDFLEYSDPLCQGPVLENDSWLHERAAFVTRAYGASVGREAEDIARGLEQAEQDLHAAAERYERVVLWFEHDSYDQLILARCLNAFADSPPEILELISVSNFPGTVRFIGLGQLPPEALRLLWAKRRIVSRSALWAGRAVWTMLRSPDPSALFNIAQAGIPRPPHLASAILRHLQELPWVGDGLSLTERLVLRLLAEGPKTIGAIFRDLMEEREPLPWLGDIMLRFIVTGMKSVAMPVLSGTTDIADRSWWRERLTITALGRAVLEGEVDWLSLRPPERWVGGVRIRWDTCCWRWDDHAQIPVRCFAAGPIGTPASQ